MKDAHADRSASLTTARPLKIAPNCWLVGHRNPASMLQCNTYLRVLEGSDGALRVCVDPGSQFDYTIVESNIQQLIGDVSEVDVLTINHQDPDVVGNTAAFCDANPQVGLVVSEDVWRLAQHLLLRPGRVEFANAARSPRTALGKGRRWQAVPTPFCHFRGAMAFYDPEIRTLFSGDLFGGFNQLGRVHLMAESDDWDGVAQFHQIYMPLREVLRYAVRQIRALSPAVEIIAPQHGHVITGDRVPEYLDRMQELLVGCDLLALDLDQRYLREYAAIVAELVDWAGQILGPQETRHRLQNPAVEDGLEQMLRMTGDDVVVHSDGYTALAKVFARLTAQESPEFINSLRDQVLTACTQRSVPVPTIGMGVEEASTS